MDADQRFLQELAELIGTDALLTGERCEPYFRDWRGRYHGQALAVALPANTLQVSAAVKLCVQHAVAVIPQGGNTSLCGGGVPLADGSRQLVINLSRMDRILALDATNYTLTVEAGCKLAALYTAAEAADRLFPLGLTAIAPHCEIGGNLSTNAGGIGVLRYGNARDLVLGLEVVLPDGRIWNGLRSLRKDNTGYDLKHLFIGAEGTLGIITAAVLKLFPSPRSVATACIAIPTPHEAVSLLAHLRSHCGDKINAFELISHNCLELVYRHIDDTHPPFDRPHDWYILTRLGDASPQALDGLLIEAIEHYSGRIAEFAVTTDPAQAERWWKLRKSISEAQKREGISIKHDVAVPVSRVAEFIRQASKALHENFPGLRIVAFGHMGDGNIHYNISKLEAGENNDFIAQHEHHVNRIVYDIVAQLEGSISAEHGLGQLKRTDITHYKDETELVLMRSIKQALDPAGLFNPGKVI